MPPQNAGLELVEHTSGTDTPKNGNLNNNNNKDNGITTMDVEPTKATIIIPPDGGFGWIVMVRLD